MGISFIWLNHPTMTKVCRIDRKVQNSPKCGSYINGLMQARRNFIANPLELCLFSIKPTILRMSLLSIITLLWRHNDRSGVSNHQPRDCLLNRLFRRGSKKTSILRVTGHCSGNSPVTGEFPTQMARNPKLDPFYDMTII